MKNGKRAENKKEGLNRVKQNMQSIFMYYLHDSFGTFYSHISLKAMKILMKFDIKSNNFSLWYMRATDTDQIRHTLKRCE